MLESTDSYSQERDRIEAVSRLVAGTVAALVVWATHSGAMSGPALQHTFIQYGIFIYILGAISIAADLWLRPQKSRTRNVLSIALDVSGVSAGLYLGAGLIDPVALFYLWIMIGSGMVYGIRYLFLAGALCLGGFGFVYLASDYWQAKPMFSATIGGLMILLGPYLASLVSSLERTRKLVTWQADHDALTGLLNRRAFEQELSQVVPGVKSDRESFLLFLDLDKFKHINDSAGHAAGDQALIDVVEIFKSNACSNHIVARMGGDEFCLLLTGTTLEEARRCAESIRNSTASYRLAWGTSYYNLGVSIGVASSLSVNDATSLIRLADAACYAAKNNGRNQVHVVDGKSEEVDTQVIRQLVLPGNEKQSNVTRIR